MDYKIIPTEITQHTELDGFDEYEAHAHGWPEEIIKSAHREIDRREYYEKEALNNCFYCGDPTDTAGFCDNPDCKAWVIDQVARALLGNDYTAWVEEYEDDGDFRWDTGIAP